MKKGELTKNDKAFREALVYWCERKNISKEELTKITGKSKRTIDYVFAGSRGMGKNTAFPLCDKLGISYGDMLKLGEWILEGNNGDHWASEEILVAEITERIDELNHISTDETISYKHKLGFLTANWEPLPGDEEQAYTKALKDPARYLLAKVKQAEEEYAFAKENRQAFISEGLISEDTANSIMTHKKIKFYASMKELEKYFPIDITPNQASENSDFTSVPKYKAKLSGGPGSLEVSDQIEANLMFRTDFLNRKGQVDKMALFEVTGESMQPFIYHGDVVLVDTSVNGIDQIVAGKTYAFRENSTVLIKRLSVQGGAIIASSENHQMNPPYHLDTESFNLIGRVVWVGHEVK